jgi:hypothetical protein
MSMAAAARSNDARIPCPLCGGLVHPIAGRCKHCKGELGDARGATPAAAAALPAIQHKPPREIVAAPPVQPAAPTGYDPYARPQQNGHAYAPTPAAYVPHPTGPVHAPPPPQAVLPPRPTGRQYVARRPTSWWKSWPVIVIILAALAIVAAVVLMVWPPGGSKKDEGKTAPSGPAPDRMDTNPLPPRRSSKDAKPAQPPAGKIDIPDDPDPPKSGGGPSAGGGLGGGTAPPNVPPDPAQKLNTMMNAVLYHACQRLKTCATADAQAFDTLCSSVTKPPPLPSCPAATRCIAKVEKMPCDAADVSDWYSTASGFDDCLNAMHC